MENIIKFPQKTQETNTVTLDLRSLPRLIKTEVRTYYVQRGCNKCEEGRMFPKPFDAKVVMELSGKAGRDQFPHKCSHCDFEDVYDVRYPTIEYAPI